MRTVIVQAIGNPTVSPAADEQHFIVYALTWHQFKVIKSSLKNLPGVRLFYCDGVLEVVGISKLHEETRCRIVPL